MRYTVGLMALLACNGPSAERVQPAEDPPDLTSDTGRAPEVDAEPHPQADPVVDTAGEPGRPGPEDSGTPSSTSDSASCPEIASGWLDTALPVPELPPHTGQFDTADQDGDGHRIVVDCNDLDRFVFPGAPERCDGQNTDCDTATGELGLATLDLQQTWTDIQDAIDAAGEGGIIYVCPGTYDENLVIEEDLAVVAPYGGPVDIRAASPFLPVVVVRNADVLLRGLDLSGADRLRNSANDSGDTADTADSGDSGADANGGGLETECATVVVRGCRIAGNTATLGGGIYAEGSVVHLQASEVAQNEAINGGGIYVRHDSQLLVDGSTISENVAVTGGGVYGGWRSFTSLNDAAVSANSATLGGGIWTAGTLQGVDVTIDANTATSSAGIAIGVNGLFMPTSWSILDNVAVLDGGGVHVDNGFVIADHTTRVTGNTADLGGGVWMEGTSGWDGGVIAGNTAGEGGGLHYSASTFSVGTLRAQVSGNTAEVGGGIKMYGGWLEIEPGSAVTSNAAVEGGGLWVGTTGAVEATAVDFGAGYTDNLPDDAWTSEGLVSFGWNGVADTLCGKLGCDIERLPAGILETELQNPAIFDAEHGHDVAISGNRIVVGRGNDTAAIFELGAAGWDLVAELAGGSMFGSAVAIDGDTVAVGAYGADEVSIYVFDGASWNLEATLAPLFADGFGHALALEGDRLVVGAPEDDSAASNAGAVFVYERVAGIWTETLKHTRLGALANEDLGWDVALDGDTLVAGAPFHGGSDRGAALVLVEIDGVWTFEAFLIASVPDNGQHFGVAVALEGDTLAVGHSGQSGLFSDEGAVSVLVRSGGVWAVETVLTPNVPTVYGYFGSELALDGGRLAVGSSGDAPVGYALGSVTLYERDFAGWQAGPVWSGSTSRTDDRFGSAVALEGERVVVGAPGNDVHGLGAGAAAVYEPDPAAPAW